MNRLDDELAKQGHSKESQNLHTIEHPLHDISIWIEGTKITDRIHETILQMVSLRTIMGQRQQRTKWTLPQP